MPMPRFSSWIMEPTTPVRTLRRTLVRPIAQVIAAMCLTVAVTTVASAQDSAATAASGVGTVEGIAHGSEGDTAPIPFALVQLVPVGTPGAPIQAITNSSGRFYFGTVPTGAYRLQLLRIGFAPVASPVLQVRAGDELQQVLRGPAEALRLPTMVVRPSRCLQSAELAEASDVSTLWNEARKGLDLRRAFELSYGYTRTVRTVYEPEKSRGRDQRVTTDRLVSTPDSVLLREQRGRERRTTHGYGTPKTLTVPNEKEMLDEAFLTNHCLEAVQSDDHEMVGLRFVPTAPEKGGLAIRGTMWLDPATFLVQRLDLEHVGGRKLDKPHSTVRIDYDDVAIGGSTLRLPVGGDVSLFEARVHVMLIFGYDQFEEARTP